MRLQPVIGLETHVQLKTKTKLFCSCNNDAENAEPNQHTCSVCLGHPGVLPVPNRQAIAFAIKLGLALNGNINETSKFDRKHYFYPDLPKAYQITQYDLPVMYEGSLTIDVPGEGEVTIGLERLHLEEDAAKNIHGADERTYVDFNRGGTPLCEIVTKPDFRSAAQAKAYLHELRTLVRTLGVSDGDIEKGHMRCDVNISMREVDENGVPLSDRLHPKTEVKNVSSFRAVERTIEYEIRRQTKLWEMNTPPAITVTRGWNDAKQVTTEQRTKEAEADYRYFPEPDIPPLELRELSAEIYRSLPELPAAKRKRYIEEYGFKHEDARIIVDDLALADFTENALQELVAWITSRPEFTEENAFEQRKKLMKLFSGWLLNKLGGLLADRKIDVRTMKITPENFAEFILLLADGKLTGPKGLEVLGVMLDSGADPSNVMDELGASRVDDRSAIESIIDTVFAANPKESERLKEGDLKLMQFFIGQIMKETRGNADHETVKRAISERLGI